MRRVNILFLLSFGLLLAIPSVGLALKFIREPPPIFRSGDSAAGIGTILAAVPARLDRFITERFGWRSKMIAWNARLRAVFGESSPDVVFGRDGWLFFNGDDIFRQITGERINRVGTNALVAVATELQAEARRNGRRFVVIVAPNKHTVYRYNLPEHARALPEWTETDFLYERLAQEGVPAIDVRPLLIARARADALYWRADTHWTPMGWLIAFNALMESLSLPDETVDVEAAFQGQEPRRWEGDLVRLAGLGSEWPDMRPIPVEPSPFVSKGLHETVIEKNGKEQAVVWKPTPARREPRPKVMVIGDSFTRDSSDLFMRFAGEMMWQHHHVGKFDRSLLAAFDPDIVVFEIVERYIPYFDPAFPWPS